MKLSTGYYWSIGLVWLVCSLAGLKEFATNLLLFSIFTCAVKLLDNDN